MGQPMITFRNRALGQALSRLIGFDTLGGQLEALIVVEGAALARRRHDRFKFLLVGDEAKIAQALDHHPNLDGLTYHHADFHGQPHQHAYLQPYGHAITYANGHADCDLLCWLDALGYASARDLDAVLVHPTLLQLVNL